MRRPLRRESIAEFRAEAVKLLSLGGMIKWEWTCFHRVVCFLVAINTQYVSHQWELKFRMLEK